MADILQAPLPHACMLLSLFPSLSFDHGPHISSPCLVSYRDLLEARRRHPGNEGHVADAFARQLKREEISMHDTVAK